MDLWWALQLSQAQIFFIYYLSPLFNNFKIQIISQHDQLNCKRVKKIRDMTIYPIQSFDHYKNNLMKLKTFLNKLGMTNKTQISRFVIGNPSVDYDSFFGSIIFSYILTFATGQFHMPIIDCPKSELGLRFQITAVLEKIKINPDTLYFRQSVKEPYPGGIFNLYDHNQRAGIHNIEYIVDHHAYLPDKLQAKKYLIDTMGSGLTLLYYLLEPNKLKEISINQHENLAFIPKYNEFVKGWPFQKLQSTNINDDDIKQIIRYGIIIDAFNFDPKMKQRWTIFDKKAVDYIEEQKNFDHGYQWLEALKFDDERNKKLTLNQSLLKDRKSYTYGHLNATYSVIYLQPEVFIKHYQEQIKSTFALNDQQEDIYFLMSIYRNKMREFKRQIIFRIKNKDQQGIEGALNGCFSSLGMINLGKIGEWSRWADPSATISRKKLQPLVNDALKKVNFAEGKL